MPPLWISKQLKKCHFFTFPVKGFKRILSDG